MPDPNGRLTFLEMIEAVRRRIDAFRFQTDPVTGDEGVLEQTNPLVTTEDIKLFLNTAVIKRSVDVNVADNTIMADEAHIDVVAGQVEYALPEDMMFLRALYWKSDSITGTLSPPNFRQMMYENDSDNPINEDLIQASHIPTYRRRLNSIVLDSVPQIDNALGIAVDYVKIFLPLLADDQVIETPLAHIIQEVVILDATIEAITTKLRLDPSEIRATLASLEARLEMAVLNYHAPKTIRMVTPVAFVQPPFGRRNLGWRRRSWWG